VADYVFVLHKNSGSSGVALKASLSSRATVVCGGLKSNVDSIKSLGSRLTVLEIVSQNSISNFFNNFDGQLNDEGPRLNSDDTKAWAQKLTYNP
jgi:predicted xylose isomerase-like sugar epimerase